MGENRVSNTINIANDSSNARKTCSPTRDDANVLVSVFGCFSLPVSYVIEVSDGLSKFYRLLSKKELLMA